jgi:hypothetical protein
MGIATLFGGNDQAKATIIAAVIALIVSLIVNIYHEYQIKKREDLSYLLGAKETVAYAALKLHQKGLPDIPWYFRGYLRKRRIEDRKLMSDAILQACIMEGSDRARATLYYFVEKYSNDEDIKDSFKNIKNIYEVKERYHLSMHQLHLKRNVSARIEAMDAIINKNKRENK